nr:FAR1 DNA binding domain-containing protein [Tanacetum cinerariifolium]
MEDVTAPAQLANHVFLVIIYRSKKEDIEQEDELESDGDDNLPKVADPNNVTQEIRGCMKTLRATLYEHNETPGGSTYWEPHIQGIPIQVEGTYFDTLDEAIDMYTNYAKMGGFEVKKSGHRSFCSRAGDVL